MVQKSTRFGNELDENTDAGAFCHGVGYSAIRRSTPAFS